MPKVYSNLDFIKASRIINLPNPNDIFEAANKGYVDTAINSALAGLDFQKDVLNIQTDELLDPGITPSIGDRYIITNSSTLNINFGTISGLENNDIVEYDGSKFTVQYDVSIKGPGALVWNRNTSAWLRFDGSLWAEFGGLAATSAGVGLSKIGDIIDVNIDNTTIEVNGGDQLSLKNGAVSALKLGTDVAGAGLGLNVSTNALEINIGNGVEIVNDKLALKLDGLSLTNTEYGLKVTDGVFLHQLQTSVVDNFVTFLNTTGDIKDSGKSINGITYKFTINVPASAANTDILITHNLQTEDVIVAIKDIATKTNVELIEYTVVDQNSLTLKFNTEVIADTFRCIVIG